MANETRGELDITIGGQEYLMRPTFNAMKSIEKAAGIRYMMIGKLIVNMEYGVDDMVAIIQCGIRGASQTPPQREIIEAEIEAMGTMKIHKLLMDFVGLSFGGADALKETADKGNP